MEEGGASAGIGPAEDAVFHAHFAEDAVPCRPQEGAGIASVKAAVPDDESADAAAAGIVEYTCAVLGQAGCIPMGTR